MKGYKAFNNDLTCLGYQYELNKTHVFDGEPKLCKKGFHFCTELQDVSKYYLDANMRVFEIEASGIITDAKEDCSKRTCTEIKLIRELSLDEVAKSITDSELAYFWAYHVGNQDIMIDKVIEPMWAIEWAYYIGNRDVMIYRISDSESAYWWAKNIGDKETMVYKVIEPSLIDKWLETWPEYEQHFKNRGLI